MCVCFSVQIFILYSSIQKTQPRSILPLRFRNRTPVLKSAFIFITAFFAILVLISLVWFAFLLIQVPWYLQVCTLLTTVLEILRLSRMLLLFEIAINLVFCWFLFNTPFVATVLVPFHESLEVFNVSGENNRIVSITDVCCLFPFITSPASSFSRAALHRSLCCIN